MRILVLSTDYPPATGGISRYSYEMARHLHLLGDDVIVLSTKQTNGHVFDSKQAFITYRASSFPVKEISYFLSALSIVKKHDVQKIFCSLWFPCGASAYLLTKLTKTKVPYYVAVHGSESFDSHATFKLRLKSSLSRLRYLTLKNAWKIFPVSAYTKNKIIETGIPEEKTAVVPNGVDTKTFNPQEDTALWKQKFPLEGKKIILTVARLDAHKGIDLVIAALPRVAQIVPGIIYLVAGQGPEERALKQLVSRLNLAAQVFFTGKVASDKELASLYCCCDVFIMPSRELPGRMDLIEGFGIAYLEAGACGKPVIGGKSGGVSDAVADGVSGILVNPSSQDEIAAALIKLLTHPDMAKTMGENGRKRMERELTWEHAAKKVRDIMEHD